MSSEIQYQYQYREIGEGSWRDCDKSWYEYASKSPELDTRVINPEPVLRPYRTCGTFSRY